VLPFLSSRLNTVCTSQYTVLKYILLQYSVTRDIEAMTSDRVLDAGCSRPFRPSRRWTEVTHSPLESTGVVETIWQRSSRRRRTCLSDCRRDVAGRRAEGEEGAQQQVRGDGGVGRLDLGDA
jgi:hypothetical protein